MPARLTIDALQRDLDAGTILPVTVAIYELADGETAIAAGEPFAAGGSGVASVRAGPRDHR